MYVNTILVDLPTKIRGFVRRNDDNCYTIVINSRLSIDMQRKAYEHEMFHITNGDFDRDDDIEIIEKEAHKKMDNRCEQLPKGGM